MKKIVRKLKSVLSNILKTISVIILIIFFGFATYWVIVVGASFFAKYSPDSIMNYKERAYEMYNEGLPGQRVRFYDSIMVSTPNVDDKLAAIERGIKYVQHTDLIQVVLEEKGIRSIKFSNNEFKIIESYMPYRELKITVDKEHITDISYYEYSQKISWKRIFTHLVVLIIIGFSIYCFSYILFCLGSELNNIKNNQNNNTDKKDKKNN